MKVKILFGKPFNMTWQDKSFKDENAVIEWCRRNADKIGCINDYRTNFKKLSHFEIMDALRGISN